MAGSSDKSNIIIEFVPNGKYMKVSAIDPETLVEVSIAGPRKARKADLEAAVMRKLDYVLNKNREQDTITPTLPPKGKGGIIV